MAGGALAVAPSGLGLVLGGVALCNLTDRLTREPGFGVGHVVDFLELPRWPVFNIADSAIVTGAVILAVTTIVGVFAFRPRPGEGSAHPDDGDAEVTGGRTCGPCSCRTAWKASASTLRWPGRSGCRAPRPPTWPPTDWPCSTARRSGKSARVRAGQVLEVHLPAVEPTGLEVIAEPVPGMTVVHDDDDIVVVDKVGVAAHLSVGWAGPDGSGRVAVAATASRRPGPRSGRAS